MTKLELIQTYWQAEHDKDLEAVLSHYAREAEIITPGGASQGRAEIADFYLEVFASYQEVRVIIQRTFENEDGIAAEYDCELVSHEGQTRMARGCNAFTIRDDKIVSLRCYYDPADF
jgi:uncharacterized protein (TIGR02246 family)